MNKKYKINKEIVLIVILIFLVSSFFLFIIYNTVVYDVTKFDMHLTVSNYTGFNVGKDAIYFGTIMPSGAGTRIINITNLNQTSLVSMKVYGKLKEWIYVSENDFILMPNENKTLSVMVRVPEDAEFRDYDGVLKIKFKRQ